jgi:hypothetical protein
LILKKFNEIFKKINFASYCTSVHRGDPSVYGRIILRWVFGKWFVGVWTGISWLKRETGGEHL